MRLNLASFLNKTLYPLNIKITRAKNKTGKYPTEASKRDIEIIESIINEVNPDESLTMVGVDRLWAVIQSTKYILANHLEGDLVECGVWRGGCAIAMAMILKDFNSNKKIWLFDTFAGMTKPSKFDIKFDGKETLKKFILSDRGDHNNWCYSSLDEVKKSFEKFNLIKNINFIKGDVLETLLIPQNLPDEIALLRLDTDWYESTKAEMEILYPKVTNQGILLIDDYGHWKGVKKAVDEYFIEKELEEKILLWKLDYSGRGLIKNI